MRTLETSIELQEMQLIRLAFYLFTIPELSWNFRFEHRLGAMPAHSETDRCALVFWSEHLLALMYGARGLCVRNVLQSMGIEVKVRVGTDSSTAAGISQRLGAGRVRHL